MRDQPLTFGMFIGEESLLLLDLPFTFFSLIWVTCVNIGLSPHFSSFLSDCMVTLSSLWID